MIRSGFVLRFVFIAVLFIAALVLLSPTDSAEAQGLNADRCQATLYSDGNWSNEIYTFYDQEHSKNLQGFNDDANSIRVANCDAIVAQHHGGSGWCYSLAPGSYRLPVNQLSYLDLDAKGCAYSDRIVVGGAWVRLDDIANHGMAPQSRCPYGVPGRGFYGTVRNNRGLDDFGLLCGEPGEAANIRGFLSPSNFRSGSPFTLTCGQNKVLVGARGTAYRNLVESISPICASVDANGNWTQLSDGNRVGPRHHHHFSRQCPNHYAVVAAEMWSGNGLDGLTLLCSPLKASVEPCPVLPTPTPVPAVPTATPTTGSGGGGELVAAQHFKPTPTPHYYRAKPTPTPHYKKKPTPTPAKVVPPPRPKPAPVNCPAILLPGTIGDRVWFDVDADGVQEAGEGGINDVLVELRDASGTLIATDFTSGNGNYLFEGYAPNNYRVTIDEASLPAGVDQTYELDGSLNGDSAVNLRSGETRLNLDFGYRLVLGTIGDRVWLDANNDGVQDAGEAGINGVRLELLQAGSVIETQITRGDGDYLFEGRRPGNYAVRVVTSTLPADSVQTYDIDGALNNRSNLTLGVADENLLQDFGYRQLGGTIGDRVWFNPDGDDFQDPGEAGINDVTVELVQAGQVVDTQVTSGDGDYLFTGLRSGDYVVRVDATTLPTNVVQTFDPDGTLDDESALSLPTGGSDLLQDFGYAFVPGTIGDRVWLDVDGNQTQDPGEAGINGVRVQLLENGVVVRTLLTTGDGDYLFENVDRGDYTVTVDPSTLPQDATQTFDADGVLDNRSSLTLAAADSNLLQDFGYRQLGGTIGDRVWLDADSNEIQDPGEAGINNVTVELLQAGQVVDTQVTSGDGDYLFTGLRSGNYAVRVDTSTLPQDATQTFDADGGLDDRSNLALSTGDDNLLQDFGYRLLEGVIGDTVWLDADRSETINNGEAGIDDVTVELVDSGGQVIGTDVTDNGGKYLFDGLASGTYTVRVDVSTLPAAVEQTFDADGLATPSESTLSLNPGGSNFDQDFGYVFLPATVGDRVWLDADGNETQDGGEAGINGVTVELVQAGVVLETMMTTGDGDYRFEGLAAGDYEIRIDVDTLPQDASQTFDADGGLDDRSSVSLVAGGSNLDQDFGYRLLEGAIGDTVWFDDDRSQTINGAEVGIDDVVVELLDDAGAVAATETTANGGKYLFENLSSGTYTVRIDATTLPNGTEQTFDADGIATADESTLTLGPGDSNLDQDFGYILLSGTIGDFVWFDDNGDGIQDTDEPGIEAALVTLFRVEGGAEVEVGQVETTSEGAYLFEGLPPADYVVTVDGLPGGDITQTADPDGGFDSRSELTLGAGERNLDQDFGYQLLGAIGNLVWFNKAPDGNNPSRDLSTFDQDDEVIPGVTVRLLVAGVEVDFQETNDEGLYNFTGLEPGDYEVRVDRTTLPGVFGGRAIAFWQANYDLDGGLAPPPSGDGVTQVPLARGEVIDTVDFGFNGLD